MITPGAFAKAAIKLVVSLITSPTFISACKQPIRSASAAARSAVSCMLLFGDGSRGATPYSFSLRPRPSVMPLQPHLHPQLLLHPVVGQMFYEVLRLGLSAGGGELHRPHIPRTL